MYLETRDTVVISDLHGQLWPWVRLHDRYGDDVRYIAAGDAVDGYLPRALLDCFVETDTLLAVGNHERILQTVFYETDDFIREQTADGWLRKSDRRSPYETNMLRDYGVWNQGTPVENATALRRAMASAGHLALIKTAPLYFETDDFIVVHAGMFGNEWREQREELDAVQQRSNDGDFSDVPIQIFDEYLKTSNRYRLADSPHAFPAAGGKTVITGHSHNNLTAEERVTDNGRRVRLASHLAKGMPLYAWQSWDGQVVEIAQH